MYDKNEKLRPWDLEPIIGTTVPKIKYYLGQPLLILFINLHCPGCVGRAIPFANRTTLEHQTEINVIGIHSNFEGPELTNGQITHKMTELYARFPYYRDAGLASTFYGYQAAGRPHWVLADHKGLIIQEIFGSDPNRALLRLNYSFEELLNIRN